MTNTLNWELPTNNPLVDLDPTGPLHLPQNYFRYLFPPLPLNCLNLHALWYKRSISYINIPFWGGGGG